MNRWCEKSSIQPWLKKARTLWKEQKIKQSMECMNKITELQLPAGRDRIFYYLDRFDRVLEGVQEVWEVEEYSAGEWNRKGAELALNGSYEEALVCFERSLDIEPDYVKAWYNRGRLLSIEGRTEEALRSFDMALLIKPDFPEARREREKILSFINEEYFYKGAGNYAG